MRRAVPLPEGWFLASFGELVELSQNGCSARKGTGEPTVVLRLADVSWKDGIRTNDPRQIPLDRENRQKYALRTGDLLAIRVNGSRDLAGQILRYEGPHDFAFCDHFIRFRVNEAVDSRYVALAFRTPEVRRQIEDRMVSTAGQHTVSQLTYSETTLPLAPLNEQRRIVAKIEALFARSRRAKEALDAIPPLLDRLRQSILAAAFRGDLTADWRAQHPDVEPADKLLERIRTERRRRWEEAELAKMRAKGKEPTNDSWKAKYTEPGSCGYADPLPSGWCWAAVEEVAHVGTGATPKRGSPEFWEGGTIPWVTSGALNASEVTQASEFVTSAALQSTNLSLYPPGTLLVAMYGEGRTRGKCSELRLEAATNQAIAAIVGDDGSPWVLATLKRYLQFSYEKTRAAGAGGVQPNLNLSMIRALGFPLMPEEEAEVLAERVEQLLARVRELTRVFSEAAHAYSGLGASILAKAFKGQLVGQNAADEPAAELLSRLEVATIATQARGSKRSRAKQEQVPAEQHEARSVPEQLSLGQEDIAEPELRDPEDYDRDRWRTCLLRAVNGEALERDDAIRLAAEWARDNLGLEFKRLRADGKIVRGLKSALNSALRRGELERVGSNKIRRSDASSETEA